MPLPAPMTHPSEGAMQLLQVNEAPLVPVRRCQRRKKNGQEQLRNHVLRNHCCRCRHLLGTFRGRHILQDIVLLSGLTLSPSLRGVQHMSAQNILCHNGRSPLRRLHDQNMLDQHTKVRFHRKTLTTPCDTNRTLRLQNRANHRNYHGGRRLPHGNRSGSRTFPFSNRMCHVQSNPADT